MIPKIIYTIWISENPLPEDLKEWSKTHQVQPGFENRFITLDNCIRGIRYVEEAIAAKKWIKVTDYLRMFYLYKTGGIYLDCDMEILKPLDDLLDNRLFVCRENEKVIANSVIGAEKENILIKKYLELAEDNFRGGGSMIFEPAERLFTDLIMGTYGDFGETKIYPEEYFFPYNEKTGETNITPNTHIFHHFKRSWKK